MRKIFKALALTCAMIAAGPVWASSGTATATGVSNAKPELASSLLGDIHQASWIAEGKGPHVIYIFFDPNCPYCHKLFEETRSYVKQGKVTLRWIPVGVLTTTSKGKAAAMLQAKDRLKAFYHNENHYSRNGGGALEEGLAGPKVEKELKANERLLGRTGFGAVPTLLYRAGNGDAELVQGAPPKERLKQILHRVK